MGLFRRPARAAGGHPSRPDGSDRSDREHLAEFAASHLAVEAYLEPSTTVTPPTLVLVAIDGEWTRRRVPDARAAERFARDAGIALHDVNITGYPSVMRAWTARQRAEGARGPEA